MNFGSFSPTIGTEPPVNPGATEFYARIGSSSPADPNTEQLVTTRPVSFTDTMQAASKSGLQFVFGPNPATSSAVAQGVSALGEGVKAPGTGIGKAATSVSLG